jgi:hypothetical protein
MKARTARGYPRSPRLLPPGRVGALSGQRSGANAVSRVRNKIKRVTTAAMTT